MSFKKKKNRQWRETEFHEKKKAVVRKKTQGEAIINRHNYVEYLDSPAWKNKRREFILHLIKEGKSFCYRCKAQGMPWFHVHHLTYKRVGNEKFSDLRFICPDCHRKIHPHLAEHAKH